MEVKYTNRYEAVGIAKEDETRLRRLVVDSITQRTMFARKIVERGGNLHGANEQATAKRRAKNKVARAQRKVNRGR